eukprot:CAMPEP_0113388154 /NCGR_PEP_ID=MMETSP0013_2-20120614/8930_1 /TAXON_ID=2843 ORGANISM="Skeletonema costatum, Strain 1716" /NCGR_SAMPLE_ID=MMETSP0013_2 /ASSEMBLY_ACC=CAM_ASM_000158 /LENGTH=352 /DNA_ID=CAMNT_0000271121 /DNA_START=62 /DNA_END=1120 /DNA_ORIENTATION=+ /assembly_acc=CAM_ASM_000158
MEHSSSPEQQQQPSATTAAATASRTTSSSTTATFAASATSTTTTTSSTSLFRSTSSIKPQHSTSSLFSSTRSLSSSTSSMGGSTIAMGGGGCGENLPPRTLARVARDVRDLVKSPPEGVRLVVDEESGMPGSLAEIVAEIEGPEDTPYHTRYFQLKLVLSTDFPSKPPRGYFLTKIYHPNVDPTTGAICVNTLKKDWTPTTSLSHVLTVIRCLMIVPFPESSLNDEAGKNFMDSYDEYAKRARLLAGVHGLTRWSSAPIMMNGAANNSSGGEGKTPENDSDNEDMTKKKQQHHHLDGKKSPTTLPNNAVDNSGSSPGKKLKKSSHHSNIVRASGNGGKSLDKKSKKKSLKRL